MLGLVSGACATKKETTVDFQSDSTSAPDAGEGSNEDKTKLCELLAKAELESASGYSLQECQYQDEEGHARPADVSAFWPPEQGEGVRSFGVRIRVFNDPGQARQAYYQGSDAAPYDVPGIGEEAKWHQDHDVLLFIKKGKAYAVSGGDIDGNAIPQETCINIAKALDAKI